MEATLLPAEVSTVHEYIGRGDFLALYVAGGVMGSMASLYWFVLRGILITSHNGASGSMFAVMAAWAYMNATRSVKK